MSIEKKASAKYTETATADAKAVNYLIAFFRFLWASTFLITAYILLSFQVSNIAITILVANGLINLHSVQRLFFKTYGIGKITIQYIAFISFLVLSLSL